MKDEFRPAVDDDHNTASLAKHRTTTRARNAKTIAIIAGLGATMAACAALLNTAKADPWVGSPPAVWSPAPPSSAMVVWSDGATAQDALEVLIASLVERPSTRPALGSPSHPIPLDSPTPPESAFKLLAGDPTVVTNGPVPDTPANRAAYGPPQSRSGRESVPQGN